MDAIAPEQDERLVDEFTHAAADEFMLVAESFNEQRRTCCRYFKHGHMAGLSHAELIDFLGVSTPSVLEMAGYSNETAQRIMEMLSDISDDEIERAAI